MGLFERKTRFTLKDSTLLQLQALPALGIDRDSTDGSFLLQKVEELMKGKDHLTRTQALIVAFKHLITREDLPEAQRPKPMPAETAILHDDHIPYSDVIYVRPCTMQTSAYNDPNRPQGTMLILEVLTEDNSGQRKPTKPNKFRYSLTNRVYEGDRPIDHRYFITSTPNDPEIYVTRVDRFILVGSNSGVDTMRLANRIIPKEI